MIDKYWALKNIVLSLDDADEINNKYFTKDGD
jgi:hypothetical protein